MSLPHVTLAQNRSCPLGKFCSVDVDCISSISACVTVCPTESDEMQQGNWTSGNCEKSKYLAS